ncbi:MAG: hypothetical protein D6768_18010 [Chloroflexi bacterium]|nr:MAG: hypothetical protein D6768_18010 [Chloroflexota bacterium]
MTDYDFNLVFEGGGAKGLVFVGAMQEFEARGYTYGRLLGTSAGAITATLLAAGFDAAELLAAVNEKLPNGKSRFSSFMDIPQDFSPDVIKNSITNTTLKGIDLPFVPESVEERLDEKFIDALMKIPLYRQIFSFIERGGLYAGQAFVDWLTEKLDQNNRNLGQTTLAEFNQKTGKDLTVVASDTTASQILVLNHRTAPNCPVVNAVRMSMSIPFVWQEVRWQAEWGLYRGQDISGHTVVDGGVLSNFPIELLISRRREVIDLMGQHDDKFAVGLLIDETLPVPGAESAEDDDDLPRFSVGFQSLTTIQRIARLINTMMRGHDKMVIDAYADGVCRLPAQGYGTTDFEMSQARSEALIRAGQTTMRQFLEHLIPFLQKNYPNKLPKK